MFDNLSVLLTQDGTLDMKKPFKKRLSTLGGHGRATNRVNKYLSQAIEARSVDREKVIRTLEVSEFITSSYYLVIILIDHYFNCWFYFAGVAC